MALRSLEARLGTNLDALDVALADNIADGSADDGGAS
jgi:hypothetical protein